MIEIKNKLKQFFSKVRVIKSKHSIIKKIILLWAIWACIIICWVSWSTRRMQPLRPDYARNWTPYLTLSDSQNNKPYLMEPFMNKQVSWDSEFYLSIAINGYNDPYVTKVKVNGKVIPLSYAFFPFYPAMIWLFSWPLKIFGMNAIATATLAGVIVSILGALCGMIALYYMARNKLKESGGFRAAFYLIIFPSAFFLSVIYTEGLFIGLAFSSLVFMLHRKWVFASILASCAVLTRSVGVVLIVPMGIIFLRDLNYKKILSNINFNNLIKIGFIILPLIVFLIWKFSYLGRQFDIIQKAWFGRGLFSINKSLASWIYAFQMVFSKYNQSMAYHLMEIIFPILALIACGFTFRHYPEIATFSFIVILFALFSGDIQGMYRYVLVAPSLFLFLSRLGKNVVFDRSWTILSILLMAVNAYLFACDMWAG
jgi:hypothetical protein